MRWFSRERRREAVKRAFAFVVLLMLVFAACAGAELSQKGDLFVRGQRHFHGGSDLVHRRSHVTCHQAVCLRLCHRVRAGRDRLAVRVAG